MPPYGLRPTRWTPYTDNLWTIRQVGTLRFDTQIAVAVRQGSTTNGLYMAFVSGAVL